MRPAPFRTFRQHGPDRGSTHFRFPDLNYNLLLAMRMRQASQAASGAGAAPDLDSLGFACVFLDCLGFPCPSGLEKLGFPWILSSETSLFNGLQGISAKNFSVSLLVLVLDATGQAWPQALVPNEDFCGSCRNP